MLRFFQNPKNQYFLTCLLTFIIWILYGVIGPGDEFFNGYNKLVLNPNDLIPIFGHPIMFNPPWLAPILAPFITMPGKSGYILFMGLTLLMFFYSSSVFKGRTLILLVSAQLFWILWWGQIDGLATLGLALGWVAYQKRSWKLLTLALLLGALKPQISAIPLFAIWCWFGKERWKSIGILFIMVLLTIWIYGPWPIWILEGIIWIAQGTQYRLWNASIGLIALPLLIPALAIKMDYKDRLLALVATSLIISPYMPYYSTIVLFVFPLPWWMILFALIGYFPNILGTSIAWNGIVFLPICILIMLYFPKGKIWFEATFKRQN